MSWTTEGKKPYIIEGKREKKALRHFMEQILRR